MVAVYATIVPHEEAVLALAVRRRVRRAIANACRAIVPRLEPIAGRRARRGEPRAVRAAESRTFVTLRRDAGRAGVCAPRKRRLAMARRRADRLRCRDGRASRCSSFGGRRVATASRSPATRCTSARTFSRWRSRWLAAIGAARPADPRRTFGYGRIEVLGALVNGTLLLVATDRDRLRGGAALRDSGRTAAPG